MDPDNVAVVACELQKNILGELFPNLQQEQPERQVQWEGVVPVRQRTKSVPFHDGKDYPREASDFPNRNEENHHRFNKFQG